MGVGVKNKQTIKKVGKIAAAGILVGAVVVKVVGDFFYRLVLKARLQKGAESAEEHTNDPDHKNNYKWLEDISTEVYVKSYDNINLHAYQILNNNNSNKYIIICHGYKEKAKKMVTFARKFYEMGYQVLIPDARGHGFSEGDYIGMGWPERRDVITWIDVIIKRDPSAEIALYGMSMGGATVMMASGEKLPKQVKCIVEDCGYTSVWDEFYYRGKQMFRIPMQLVMRIANRTTNRKAGYDLKKASAVKQVAKSVTPMLFIHGDKDESVPFTMLDQVYEAAKCEKERLVVKGAVHANSHNTDPELYWSTVNKFIEKYMSK